MDAFQYWRQPTWAYTTDEESERKCRGLDFILQELERSREESLQQGSESRMENTMESMEKKYKEINEGLENISKKLTEAILPYFEEKSIIEEEKEEPPRSKWEELLEICMTEVQENRKVTNQRLMNLERHTDLLEQGFASLVAQVGELEYNMGILATAIGKKENAPTDPSPAVDAEQPPAAAAPLCGGPPPESQSPESHVPSNDSMTMPPHEDEEDETNKTVVNSFKPSLSMMLIPFIANKADFGEDSQLSHAWRKSWSKSEKSKFKLRSCPKYLMYNLCGFNLLCPLSHSVFAQSSAATLDKLRRAWVRYKVQC